MINDKFKLKCTSDGDKTRVFLTGIIDEDSDLSEITALKTAVILNFNAVASINSVGIRLFIRAVEGFGAGDIFYEECPVPIVRQLTMVPSFLGNAKVLSIYAPFVCGSCEAEKMVLLTADQFIHGKLELPEDQPCHYCKTGRLEFDGSPVKYFAFTTPHR